MPFKDLSRSRCCNKKSLAPLLKQSSDQTFAQPPHTNTYYYYYFLRGPTRPDQTAPKSSRNALPPLTNGGKEGGGDGKKSFNSFFVCGKRALVLLLVSSRTHTTLKDSCGKTVFLPALRVSLLERVQMKNERKITTTICQKCAVPESTLLHILPMLFCYGD